MSTLLWSPGEPATDWSLLDQYGRDSSALLRLWRGVMTARCFVAVVLLLLQAVTFALGQPLALMTGQSTCVPTGTPLVPVVAQTRAIAS